MPSERPRRSLAEAVLFVRGKAWRGEHWLARMATNTSGCSASGAPSRQQWRHQPGWGTSAAAQAERRGSTWGGWAQNRQAALAGTPLWLTPEQTGPSLHFLAGGCLGALPVLLLEAFHQLLQKARCGPARSSWAPWCSEGERVSKEPENCWAFRGRVSSSGKQPRRLPGSPLPSAWDSLTSSPPPWPEDPQNGKGVWRASPGEWCLQFGCPPASPQPQPGRLPPTGAAARSAHRGAFLHKCRAGSGCQWHAEGVSRLSEGGSADNGDQQPLLLSPNCSRTWPCPGGRPAGCLRPRLAVGASQQGTFFHLQCKSSQQQQPPFGPQNG